jgi:hypothetical protein
MASQERLVPDLFLQFTDDSFDESSDLPDLGETDALEMMATAEFVGSKLIPWGSNYSFAVAMGDDKGPEALAIYKPRDGENPLYDFPEGTLYLREVAAYRLSCLLGWGLVPPTVVRDGPMGIGSLQLYKAPSGRDQSCDPREFWSQRTVEIERLVLFDHLANNADRKLSHCLIDAYGAIWGIDHGLCFNADTKLRTVLWQFVGQPINRDLVAEICRLRARESDLRMELEPLINENELVALLARLDRYIADPTYPILNPHRNIPYGWW